MEQGSRRDRAQESAKSITGAHMRGVRRDATAAGHTVTPVAQNFKYVINCIIYQKNGAGMDVST
jgi:hypothetical protein